MSSSRPPSRGARAFACATAFVACAWMGPAAAQEVAEEEPAVAQPAPRVEDARPVSPRKTIDPLDHFRIGVVGGVGFPRPLSVTALMKIERVISFGVEYSQLPATTILQMDLRATAIAADVRIFPFESSFYLGLRMGRQLLTVASEVTAATHATTVTGAISTETFFLNPRIGVLLTSGAGFSVGIEAGVQLPLSKVSTSTIPSGVAVPDSVTFVTRTFGERIVPTLTLLQLGLLI